MWAGAEWRVSYALTNEVTWGFAFIANYGQLEFLELTGYREVTSRSASTSTISVSWPARDGYYYIAYPAKLKVAAGRHTRHLKNEVDTSYDVDDEMYIRLGYYICECPCICEPSLSESSGD